MRVAVADVTAELCVARNSQLCRLMLGAQLSLSKSDWADAIKLVLRDMTESSTVDVIGVLREGLGI
jgi:hypothetical protein